MVIKHCPKCGNDIDDEDIEFCTECGHKLSNKIIKTNSKGFFDKLNEKTSFSVIVFSFIIFGVFLFIGSAVWSSFMANGSIDFVTYLLLVIVFSVFFGGIFVGYFGCRDESYIIPNFSIYLGSIFSVILCGIGLIFTFLMGVISILSSILPFGSSNSISQTSTPSYAPSVDLSFIFKLILVILLIPVTSYIGVYLGYFLKKNI